MRKEDIMHDTKKVLVVVDMQNDFCAPEGALSNPECTAAIEKVNDLIASEDWNAIIYTRDTHYSNYLETQEGRNLPIPHCMNETWGHEVCVDIPENVNTVFLDKTGFGTAELPIVIMNSFDHDELANVELTFCGVCTDICVISNVMTTKAYLRETPIRVVAEACAGLTPEKHEHALDVMASVQCEIV